MSQLMTSMFSQSLSYAARVTLSLGVSWLGISPILSATASSDLSASTVPLDRVQQVRIEALSLTERGVQESSALQTVVGKRFAQVGFSPVHGPNTPSDIVVRVKCEERKTQTGIRQHRKGGHASATAFRLWKGPACHISYRYQGKPSQWHREVKTSFEDPRQAAKAAGAQNVGQYALQALQAELAQDEFPLYLAAEWGQTDRLIQLLQDSTDQPDRGRLILQLLGSLTSPDAFSAIKDAIANPELAAAAITALGAQGERAIPALMDIVNSSEHSEHQLMALTSLGGIAARSAPPALYDVFIQQLESQDPRMQTIAIRGLGRLGDARAVPPIEALNIQAWSDPSTHADMVALREALNWSLYQLDASSSSH